jgi:aryl-alcohol dehydrogenase-like predicted oxidoreductase
MAKLGNLDVSAIGLGCNNFGRALDAEGSAVVVNAALEAGVTYFDTASNYGEGQSESFLRAGLGSRRNDVVIGTKFGMAVKGWEGSGGASPEYVRKVTERSLRELDTDYIDLLMIHFPDPETPIEDTLEAMSILVDQGKVRQIGCSQLDPTPLTEALDVSEGKGLAGFVGNQVQYSMLHREPETSGLNQVCLDRGVGLLPFYPLGNGLLTGKTRRGEPPKGRLQMDRYQNFLTDENFDLVEGVEAFARARDLSMVEVALGWLLAQEAVPSVTPGATTAEQVASNVRAADWAPSSDDLAELARVLGG